MATKISLSNGPADPTERRVTEDASSVSMEINAAINSKFKFVIFTDADSGKEFSVQPERVLRIEAD